MAISTAAIVPAAITVRPAVLTVTSRPGGRAIPLPTPPAVRSPWICSMAQAGFGRFPHYSHWAATIGIGILAIMLIVAVIAAARGGRRRH
ncbi:hypothetical protein [Actinoallomurus sp. CA-150999]|uniref:hypothetical protein n=1 Tax=Actinoallomurus sp. CA-150999 TaxID=3239887 RepID=UPI003D90EFCD